MTVQNSCFGQDLEASQNYGILVKKFQCNEAMNEAIFEWQAIKMCSKKTFLRISRSFKIKNEC